MLVAVIRYMPSTNIFRELDAQFQKDSIMLLHGVFYKEEIGM